MFYGVRPFALFIGFALALGLPLAVFLALRPPAPYTPKPCHSSAEIIAGNDNVQCSPGAKIEVFTAGFDKYREHPLTLVKCTCLETKQP